MAELVSRGDIRILGGLGALNRDSSAVLTTQFATPGDLTLTAAQIYPETGAVVRVAAGGRQARRPTGFRGRQPPRDPARRRSVAGHALQRLRHVAARGRHHRTGRRAARAARPAGDRRGEHQRPHLARDAAARQRHLRQRTRPDDALWRHRRRRRLSMAGAGRAPDRPGRRGIPWQPVRGPAARRPDRAGRRQRTGGPVRRRTAAGRGFHLGPRRLHRRALQSAGADQSSRRLHPARPVHQSRLRAGAGCPAHGRADRAGRGPEPAADRPAGHHRRRRSRIAGRHLHADAVHLRPDARRLPRRDQRRDARPGCCRRAAAAQWLLVHRRPPGQCLGRYRRRRAAPVADQLGPGAAPVLAVQRNGLRRLRGGRRARRGQPRALAPADARTLRLLLARTRRASPSASPAGPISRPLAAATAARSRSLP